MFPFVVSFLMHPPFTAPTPLTWEGRTHQVSNGLDSRSGSSGEALGPGLLLSSRFLSFCSGHRLTKVSSLTVANPFIRSREHPCASPVSSDNYAYQQYFAYLFLLTVRPSQSH